MCIRSGFNWPDVELQESRWCVKSGGLIMLHKFQPLSETSSGLFVALQALVEGARPRDTASLLWICFSEMEVLSFTRSMVPTASSSLLMNRRWTVWTSKVVSLSAAPGTEQQRWAGNASAAAGAAVEVTSEVLCHEYLSVSRTVVSPVLLAGGMLIILAHVSEKMLAVPGLLERDLAVIYSISCWFKPGSAQGSSWYFASFPVHLSTL